MADPFNKYNLLNGFSVLYGDLVLLVKLYFASLSAWLVKIDPHLKQKTV